MNLTDSWWDFLDGVSGRRKAVTCSGQHKQKEKHRTMTRVRFELTDTLLERVKIFRGLHRATAVIGAEY
jgi:hypothetical protein